MNRFLDILSKARVIRKPGSRGGVFYYDRTGAVAYGIGHGLGGGGFSTAGSFLSVHQNWTVEQHATQQAKHEQLGDTAPREEGRKAHRELAAAHKVARRLKSMMPAARSFGPEVSQLERWLNDSVLRAVQHADLSAKAPAAGLVPKGATHSATDARPRPRMRGKGEGVTAEVLGLDKPPGGYSRGS